jgi:hypothetical protein
MVLQWCYNGVTIANIYGLMRSNVKEAAKVKLTFTTGTGLPSFGFSSELNRPSAERSI